MKIVLSRPKDTLLSELEQHAADRYGGTWRACPTGFDCWPDPVNPDNFCWLLEQEVTNV